ncbi:MAG: hypothetical protein JXA39_06355 [Bacteroidales bacterium]|nr:hypothetical protein [Bacteroidales bacterium]
MKKLLILTIVGFMSASLFGQDPSTVVLLNYSTLEKKVEKSNKAIAHEKKSQKSKTWVKRGELFQDVFLFGIEHVQEGMAPMTLKLFYREPTEIKTETRDGVNYETHVYDHIKYVFSNNALQYWELIDPIHPDPLEESMNSYIKAIDLDEKGTVAEKIKENLVELKNQFKRDGVNNYYIGDNKEALNAFKNVLKINELDVFSGEFDTIMVQYSGIISREIASKTGNKELYLEAIKFYDQLAETGYGGPNTYLQMKMDWMAYGDTAKAMEVLLKGYEKYPDTINLVANIADTYILMDEIDEGLKFIDRAIENTPDAGQIYYWKGRLIINKQEDQNIEEAVEAYTKAGELNPGLYYVWYDLGYIYYLQGADYYDRANLEENDNIRRQLLDLGKERYDKAIPVLEKSLTLNEDINREVKFETLDLLQRIYYKEQMMEDYERVKALKEAL